eukprot:scaffold107079_cov72-Phaeocystis_antarctica.AAC.3
MSLPRRGLEAVPSGQQVRDAAPVKPYCEFGGVGKPKKKPYCVFLPHFRDGTRESRRDNPDPDRTTAGPHAHLHAPQKTNYSIGTRQELVPISYLLQLALNYRVGFFYRTEVGEPQQLAPGTVRPHTHTTCHSRSQTTHNMKSVCAIAHAHQRKRIRFYSVFCGAGARTLQQATHGAMAASSSEGAVDGIRALVSKRRSW